jgi:hypothetical protein
MSATVTASLARRKAFRIVSGIVGTLVVAFTVPFLIASFVVSEQEIHVVHNIGGLAGFGLILGATLVLAAWRPESMISPFQAALAGAILSAVGGLASGDFISGVWFSSPVAAAILFPLHPARAELLRFSRPQIAMLLLAAAAAVPAVGYALSNAELQRTTDPALDPHSEMHHWSGMAVMALVIVGAAAVAALRTRGWRATAWLAGLGAALYGIASIVWPNHAGAEGATWGSLSLAWGVAVVLVAELSPRRRSRVP